MRGIDFIFDCIYSRYHKCHKINFKRGGSFSWLDKKQKSNSKSY